MCNSHEDGEYQLFIYGGYERRTCGGGGNEAYPPTMLDGKKSNFLAGMQHARNRIM